MNKSMILYEDESFIHMRIACSCGEKEHDAVIYFDGADKDEMVFQVDAHVHVWNKNPLMKIWMSLVAAFKILTGQRVTLMTDFILDKDNRQELRNILDKVEEKVY